MTEHSNMLNSRIVTMAYYLFVSTELSSFMLLEYHNGNMGVFQSIHH